MKLFPPIVLSLVTACFVSPDSFAQTPTPEYLPEVVVRAESVSDEFVQEIFLPPVEGTRILVGKKASVIDLDAFPRITNNNYRQALAKTPGLLLSEESSPLVSIGYRGLDPHRAQFTQVLKDGIPIHADQFGYPEAYFTPPLDTIDRIEFFRGGAALLYGTQPGGALNYVTHRPRLDRPFSFGTNNTFGTDNYFSNFSYIEGTQGRLGYYAYYNHREGDGFRTSNSQFELNAAQIKLVLDGDTDSRWILTLEAYEEEHGEPGGLTFATGPGLMNYNEDRSTSSRLHDLFKLKRYSTSLAWERDFTEETRLTMTAWGTMYQRYSSRQRGGGFGMLPTGPNAETTSVEDQKFYTLGLDARVRHDYLLLGGEHTFTAGVQVYRTESPREDRRGETRDARGGKLRNESDREVFYAPVFLENRFHIGALSVTPGVRFENIWQSVKEHRNVDKTAAGTPLADESYYEFVPLFGLGISYEAAKKVEIYANVSQSYRPRIFSQSVPSGATTVVPTDLEDSKAWQYEIGFRGNPRPWVSWDVSAFLLDFDDQIGAVVLPDGRSTLANVGRAQHMGIEAAAELDVIGLIDALQGRPAPVTAPAGKGGEVSPALEPTLVERFGSLRLHGNVMLLDAEYVSGPNEGLTPRYAPDYLVRAGVVYDWRQRFQLAFLGTFVGDTFADDAETPQRAVPAYMVWDLTAEAKIYRDIFSINAGINNIFDEDYYARVRDDGIDPAYGRNHYIGFTLKF